MANAALLGPFGRIVLGSTPLNVGYTIDNMLVINDAPLPSLFAIINTSEQSYTITAVRDSVSVNGQLLRPGLPFQFHPGDTVNVDQTTFRYEEEGTGSHTPIPAITPHENPYGDTAYDEKTSASAFHSSPTVQVTPTPHITQEEDTLAQGRPFVPAPPSTPIPSANSTVSTGSSPQWSQQPMANNNFYQTSSPSTPPPFIPAQGQFSQTPSSSGQSFVSPPPVQRPPQALRTLRMLLLGLVALLLLLAIGSGIALYQLTRPQPIIAVSSQYSVGTTPAGSVGTSFHMLGYKFSGNSPITLLLDNNPVTQEAAIHSDADGNFQADVPVASNWSIGTHKLTARDGGNYLTKNVGTLAVVSQGQAHTPGPGGAPPDDASFTIKVTIKTTGSPSNTYTDLLTVSSQPGHDGGTVCNPNLDTNQTTSDSGNGQNGTTYKSTVVYSCSGTYKAGKLSYTETITNYKSVYSDGVTCQTPGSYPFEKLDGAFSNGTAINGTYNTLTYPIKCSSSDNRFTNTGNSTIETGTWTATIV